MAYTPGNIFLKENNRNKSNLKEDWLLGVKVHGYQCKAGRKLPEKDPAGNFIHKAFLLRSTPAEKPDNLRNWEFLGYAETMSLLGWSLAPFMPVETENYVRYAGTM